MCMPLSSKFLESTGKQIVKIGQYLMKIWSKCNNLLFWATVYIYSGCAVVGLFRVLRINLGLEHLG